MAKQKLTASQRKNLKKKEMKRRRREREAQIKAEPQTQTTSNVQPDVPDTKPIEDDIEIEYVAESVPDAATGEMGDVFARFAAMGRDGEEEVEVVDEKTDVAAESSYENQEVEQKPANDEPKLSRKERKRQRLQSVGLLKQIVARPDVVEVWDATAPEPEFLVYLKSYRNTVPVPRHWCRKKKYLQGKRGVDKKPFELPDFIQATGIAKLREAYVEREEMKRLKQKSRERVQPKMGKMNINYSVLHDAFFKHQKKPDSMTAFGDLYYEGREYETNLTAQRPGVLSSELQSALGVGPNDPPPFLFNMQRVGPPPSYPNLKIPGLNAPIPPGATYGFGPGQWGQPPVDHHNRPLYGDVFGTAPVVAKPVTVDRTQWGQIVDESDSESEDETSSDESESESDDDAVEMAEEPVDASGFESTASGMTSVTGLATPSSINLRKGLDTPSSSVAGDGFTVLQQVGTSVGDALMGTTHTYAIPSQASAGGAEAEEPVQEMNLSKKRKATQNEDDKKRLKF